MDRAQRIVELAQQAVDRHAVFTARGAGAGNRVTSSAVAEINDAVAAEMGREIPQRRLGQSAQSVDFYLEPERVVIEIEFSLSNPYPCLEKDLLKVLVARDAGVPVDRLLLIGDPGSQRRLNAPAPRAIIAWAERRFGIAVQVVELKSGLPSG